MLGHTRAVCIPEHCTIAKTNTSLEQILEKYKRLQTAVLNTERTMSYLCLRIVDDVMSKSQSRPLVLFPVSLWYDEP